MSRGGNLPIHLACAANNHIILELMIEAFDQTPQQQKQLLNYPKNDKYWKYTPLMVAIANKSVDCVELLSRYRDIDILSYKARYPNYNGLEYACHKGNLAILKLLLSRLWYHNVQFNLQFVKKREVFNINNINKMGQIIKNNSQFQESGHECAQFLSVLTQQVLVGLPSTQSLMKTFLVKKNLLTSTMDADSQEVNKSKRCLAHRLYPRICVCYDWIARIGDESSDKLRSLMDKCCCCKQILGGVGSNERFLKCRFDKCGLTYCHECLVGIIICKIATGKLSDSLSLLKNLPLSHYNHQRDLFKEVKCFACIFQIDNV